MERDRADEEEERQRVLAHLQAHPGQSFEEADITKITAVPKMWVRRLVRGGTRNRRS